MACMQVPRDAIDVEGRIVDQSNSASGVCAGVEGPVDSVGTVVSSTREDGRAPRPRPTTPVAGLHRELHRRGVFNEFVAAQQELQQTLMVDVL